VELLDTRVGAVQSQLDSKVDTVELDNLRVELNDRIDSIPTRDVDVLRSRVDELQVQLDGKVDNTTFDSALASKVDNTVFRPAGLAAGKVNRLEGRISPP
jgi:hypothetical protein